MRLLPISSSIPSPVRMKLSSGKWHLLRLPYALQYRASLIIGEPIDKLVHLLPAPANPPVYWVELNKIKLHASLGYPAGRLCMSGNWDLNMVHPLPSVFEAIPKDSKKWDLHETVRAMFLFGQHYTTTPQFELMSLAVEKKAPNPPQGCRSVAEIHNYFQRLNAAFESMQRHGYLTQQEQGKSSVEEIRLHLTRDGHLCLGGGGNHRIRMAEILGIRWVPFLLRGVHPLWLLHISRQLSLPPHKAIATWMNNHFHTQRPLAD